jgi:sugar phosphate isomerase/epimerase
VKLCFDAGHANLDGDVLPALETTRDSLVTTHIHDNRGERDDHLLPYEGTIDWDALVPALPPSTPIVLELKEPAVAAGSSEVQAFAETLQGARVVFDKFAQALAKA